MWLLTQYVLASKLAIQGSIWARKETQCVSWQKLLFMAMFYDDRIKEIDYLIDYGD